MEAGRGGEGGGGKREEAKGDQLCCCAMLVCVCVFATRSGFLLTKVPCQAMVEYVYQELTANKQNTLIEHWTRL